MITVSRRLSFLVCVAGFGLSVARADLFTVDKARAYVGGEASINAVRSLRFFGDLEVIDASDSGPPGTARLELLFQKPDRQRITAINGTRVETTALDGYDAWQRVSDTEDASLWQVALLGPDQIKRLRAKTFENLSFFRGIETLGGHVEDLGPVMIDGIECRKLAFVHGPGIVFVRSFDASTGRLILTETEDGTSIREEGEIKAGGLRFPCRVITTNHLAGGGTRVIRITFQSVEVNPELDASAFSIPSLAKNHP